MWDYRNHIWKTKRFDDRYTRLLRKFRGNTSNVAVLSNYSLIGICLHTRITSRFDCNRFAERRCFSSKSARQNGPSECLHYPYLVLGPLKVSAKSRHSQGYLAQPGIGRGWWKGILKCALR